MMSRYCAPFVVEEDHSWPGGLVVDVTSPKPAS
jgi:hypothetical protein